MQLLVVILILAVSVFLTVRHFYRTLTTKEKGCMGCPLKDVCDKQRRDFSTCGNTPDITTTHDSDSNRQ